MPQTVEEYTLVAHHPSGDLFVAHFVEDGKGEYHITEAAGPLDRIDRNMLFEDGQQALGIRPDIDVSTFVRDYLSNQDTEGTRESGKWLDGEQGEVFAK